MVESESQKKTRGKTKQILQNMSKTLAMFKTFKTLNFIPFQEPETIFKKSPAIDDCGLSQVTKILTVDGSEIPEKKHL